MNTIKRTLFALAIVAPAAAGSAAPVTAGNDFYTVLADPARNGAYAVGTGPRHPVTLQEGTRSNVLRGGYAVGAGLSFNSLRSYSSNTDYFFGFPLYLYSSDVGFECVLGNDAASPLVEPISDGGRDVGLRLTWSIHRGADDLLVEEKLVAHGDDFTTSIAEVTLTVTNQGTSEAEIGMRYAWAWAVGNAGGTSFPTIGPKPPEPAAEPFNTYEHGLDPSAVRSFVVSLEERPSDPGPVDDNAYVVEATMGGIPLDPAPTPPDRYLHTVWGEQLDRSHIAGYGPLNTCFGYDISDPPRIAYRGPNTAGVYLWGDTPDTARVLGPGETTSVTQYIFAYLEFPLSCDAGPAQVLECQGASTEVELDGSASRNVTGEGIDYLWSSDDPAITFDDPTVERPTVHVSDLGSHEVRLLAHRGGFATSCATSVEVVDTTPPVVEAVRVAPAILWPPSHRLIPVHVTLEAGDLCDANPTIRLISVLSSEPDETRRGGDGHTTGDIQGADIGTADFDVLLRAERLGEGIGRTYTLTYEITDTAGNAILVPVEVKVPHDQRLQARVRHVP